MPGSLTAWANCWFFTVNPATVTLSCPVVPDIEPEPYSIEKAVLFFTNDFDFDASKRRCTQHAGLQHDWEGTQRLLDPVSKMLAISSTGLKV